MKADYTRSTFKVKKHYNSVRMQQGRVQLDADWNEQMDITARRVETETVDSVGHCGAPMHQAGFHLVKDTLGLTTEEQKIPENKIAGPAISGGDFHISSGRYYVDGILCENEKIVPFSEQPDVPPDAVLNSLPGNFPGKKETLKEIKPPSQPGTFLAYLDVWSRHITALEDKEIREVALGGPDTATRTKTVWQVKLLRVGGEKAKVNCLSSQKDWPALKHWDALVKGPDGKLGARAEVQKVKDKPCILAPGAGYRRLENQLYRIEVHEDGKLGEATFKWSRDNGTVVAKWDGQDGDKLTVSSTGRDNVLNFAGGQWVELTDDTRELLGKPGILVKLKKVDKEGSVLTIDATTITKPVKWSEFPGNPRVRRWDTRPGEPAVLNPQPDLAEQGNSKFIDLEDGVQVKFSSGAYKTGDYWLVPARTATANVEWPIIDETTKEPELQSPHGIRHHYCRLALLRFKGSRWTEISDCRRIFPPVTELTSLFYISGDGQEAMPGVELPKPLQVGVSNGQWPVSDLKIRFKLLDELDGGALKRAPGGSPANELVVLTGPGGVAECYWELGSNKEKPSQQGEATLLNAADDPVHLPIRFTANLSIASQVYYDTKDCANLQGADNVQLALEKLSQHKTISYHAGDGQEALPGDGLPQFLQVRVANKCGPVVGAKVHFETMEGGLLSKSLGQFSNAGNTIEVDTKDGGIAGCAWKLKNDPDNYPSQQLVATLIPPDGDVSNIQLPNTIVFTANLSFARQVAYDSANCSTLVQAGANNVQEAIDGLCTKLELLTRCCRFLDDLRADGVISGERGVLGFEVTKSDNLTVRYTGGVAYVGGCRYELEADKIEVNGSASGQLLLINEEGKVVLIVKDALPRRYALLAIIASFQGDIKRIVDARLDLTHLDEKVETNVHRVASSHTDRRQFVPLLSQTLPELQYRDGRNYTFTGTGQAYGLVFDGKAVWVPNMSTSVPRIDCKASDDSGVTTVDTSDRTYAGAFDGKYVWLTSPRKVNPAGDGLDPNNKVLLINSETLDVENTLTTGDGPFAIAFDGNFMWVANTESNSVSLFDIETHEEVRTIGLEKSPPRALAFDGTYMWIASANGSLVRIQGHRGDPEEVALPDSIRRLWGQLVFDGSNIWAKGMGGQIIKINVVPLGGTDNVINCEVIPVTEQFPGSPAWLGGMVFDGRHMWIPAQAQSSDNRYIVHKGDADTNNNLGSIQLQQTAVTCGAFDGAHLWFAGLTPTVSKILIG